MKSWYEIRITFVKGAMKLDRVRLIGAIFITNITVSLAEVRYVSLSNPGAAPPYVTWATAATNIQDAIDVSTAGDEIVVTNGIYETAGRAVVGTMTNRVAVDRPVLLRSVNGPQFTTIRGYQLPGTTNGDGAIRCVYLTNGASISGFTLANGATRSVYEAGPYPESSGGGIWCEPTNVFISNCVITASSANQGGGGVFRGILNNCVISNNRAQGGGLNSFGGGAAGGVLNNCELKNNSCVHDGGGAIGGALTNCTLTGNTAADQGGGAGGSTMMSCIIRSNSAAYGGGVEACKVYNSLLIGNSAQEGGGAAFCVNFALNSINNCTLVYNSATAGGGTSSCNLYNCINVLNSAPTGQNYEGTDNTNCCTAPLAVGAGNFTNFPVFVDPAMNNFRLSSNSPCINAGNNSYVIGTVDLDGRPRIVDGTVDVGAYEFKPSVNPQFIGWLQQYSLPTDGSADFSDSDGDGMNNWGEWRCDTIPTNAMSVLRMVSAANGSAGLNVTWQSTATRSYSLERATNLGAPVSFQIIASSIAGLPGATTYTDPNATNSSLFFYRVSVP
jgi:hypothetical protein